jgi:putative GTP pyrophosphokinase
MDQLTPPEIDAVMNIYTSDKQKEVEVWFKDVRHELDKWMESQPRKRVHSVRARMKERSHLKAKIARWHEKHATAPTQDSFFEEIEDLAGTRILVLYRHDLAIVDHFVHRSRAWQVLKAEANCDAQRQEDVKFFMDLGFREDRPCRRLRPISNGCSSVHYILVKPGLSPDTAKITPNKCELQVRTIHEEAWGEFSHEFTYPIDQVDTLAKNLIRRLSGLLHQAEDIVSDIRRSPADGRLFRAVHQQLWEGALGRLPPEITFDVVHEMLAEVQFMTRSAPLAAVGILTPYGGTKPNVEHGTPIKADEVITLGLGEPSNWSYDELQKLYLESHAAWRKADPAGNRRVCKFFVWSPPQDSKAKPWQLDVPPLLQGKDTEFWVIRREVYDQLHRQLRAFVGIRDPNGNFLEGMQFFLWRTGGLYEPAELPYRTGTTSKKATGFYSPSPDPDLLGGMLWLPDEEDEEHKTLKALHAYGDFLMDLSLDKKLATRLVGKTVIVPAPPKGLNARLDKALQARFDGIKFWNC